MAFLLALSLLHPPATQAQVPSRTPAGGAPPAAARRPASATPAPATPAEKQAPADAAPRPAAVAPPAATQPDAPPAAAAQAPAVPPAPAVPAAPAEKPPPSREDLAWTAAGRTYGARRWAPAQDAYTRFRGDFPLDERAAEALYRIGVCFQQRGDAVRALGTWRDVLRFSGSRPAELAARLNAAEALIKAAAGPSGRRDRDELLARLAREFPSDNKTVVHLHTAEARARLEEGDGAAAARLFAVVEPSLSELDKRYHALARAHAGRGVPPAATVIELADHLLAVNEPAQATAFYKLALKCNPTAEQQRQANTCMGWALYLQQELDEAERLWRRVIADSPEKNEWRGRSRWHLIVLAAGHRNDVKRAIALCREQTLEFAGSPFGEQALFSQAWLLKITGRLNEARESFEELVVIYPAKRNNPHIQQYIAEVQDGLDNKPGGRK